MARKGEFVWPSFSWRDGVYDKKKKLILRDGRNRMM